MGSSGAAGAADSAARSDSIGSIIAGWVAFGYSPGRTSELVEKCTQDINDYTLPVASLLSGHKITRLIDDNTHKYESFMMLPDGAETKEMEIMFTRM